MNDNSPQALLLDVLGTVLVVAVVGCSKPPYDVAPVRGTVTVDGQRLTAGRVMFAPVDKAGELNPGKPAFGRIGPEGSFVLSTYRDEDGAVVGEHHVTVAALPGGNAKESGEPKYRFFHVPATYHVLAGQQNEIDIQITKAEVARYGR